MTTPHYQEVNAQSIPTDEKDGVKVRLVAGEYSGIKGPVTEIAAQPLYMDVTLEPGTTFTQAIPDGHTAVVYVFEGQASFGGANEQGAEFVQSVRMAVLSDGESLRVQTGTTDPVRFMLMAGAPFKEPIVPYGPFVMNTRQEIEQALTELRNGTFIKE
jgi:hypothetical protein